MILIIIITKEEPFSAFHLDPLKGFANDNEVQVGGCFPSSEARACPRPRWVKRDTQIHQLKYPREV